MKILLIDDDEAIKELFSHILQKAGYEITPAGTGKEALEKAKQQEFDLILLDQILPDMSGNDVLIAFKADIGTKNVPIAIVSNYSQEDIMQNAIKMGAVDYILKYQIEPQDLIQKVQQIIQANTNTI